MAEELRHAISQGDLHLVSYLIDSGISINKPFNNGLTPLNYAISNHQQKIATVLLDHGAKISQPDSFIVDECGRCPIHYAAACNLLGLVSRLIGHGVDVEELDYGHSTALHHAAHNGNIGITSTNSVAYSLSNQFCNGGRVVPREGVGDGKTLSGGISFLIEMSLLLKVERDEIVQYLVELGCNINHQSKSGKTAIWKAVINKNQGVVHFLLKCGVDINLQNKVGTTILYDCIKLDLNQLCSELINYGADPSLTDIEQNNALHFASSLGRTRAIEILISTGEIDLNSGNEYGNTALHNSSMYNFVQSTVLLLNSCADPTILNRNGHSCLYLTMQRRQYECTQLLHDYGVMLNDLEALEYQQFLEYRTVSYYEEHELFADWALQYFSQPKSLFILSIRAVRSSIKHPLMCSVDRLRLPKTYKDYILLRHYRNLAY